MEVMKFTKEELISMIRFIKAHEEALQLAEEVKLDSVRFSCNIAAKYYSDEIRKILTSTAGDNAAVVEELMQAVNTDMHKECTSDGV